MKAFVAIVALIACALAQSIPENMCSVQASGTAVLMIDNANPETYKGAMFRVGDYVFYSVTDNNMNVVAAVLVRPDHDQTFFWKNGQDCITRPALKLSTYQPYQGKTFTQTAQGILGRLSGLVSFDDSDKLTTESVSVYYSDGEETHSVTVSIVYDTWNYSYVNEDENFFEMMNSFHCGDSSKTPAPGGKTSVQCPAPPTPSGSTSGGGSTSNSTSGGSTSGGSTSGGSTSGGSTSNSTSGGSTSNSTSGGSTSNSTSGGSTSGGSASGGSTSNSTSNSTSGGSTSGSTSSGKTGEIPADMCSVEAMGSAVLSYDGYPYSGQLVAMMMRVKNYAQYALIDSTTGNVTTAVLMRPDTGKTYLWMEDEDCINRPALNLFSYEHVAGKTFSKTVTDLTGSITFDGSDKLSAEIIQVAFTQGGQSHIVTVAITYDPNKVNYSFVNEDDDEFMAPANFECGAASMTPAADAKTSLQCSAASSTKPTPTSSSAKPTPSTSSSTKPTPTSSSAKPTPTPTSSQLSAASFVVPSALLLIAAVVAMF